MPGGRDILAKYMPQRQGSDTYILNGSAYNGPGDKKDSNTSTMTSPNLASLDPETPSDSTQIKFLPRSDGRLGSTRCWHTWSTKERYFLFLCAVLFILCLIFIAVAFTRDKQYRSMLNAQSTSNSKVCMTRECVTTASQLMAGMDYTADPCQDFFQFACGQWNRKHVIPADKPMYNTFEKLHDELQIVLRGLLEDPTSRQESEAVVKAKKLYKSCMNISNLETIGDQPLRDVVRGLGGWPFLDANWTDRGFVLEDMLAKLKGTYGANYILNCVVGADDKNSSVNIVQIDQGTLGMPSREYFLLEEHEFHLEAYQRLIKEVATLLGGVSYTFENQLQEMLSFETELAKVTIPPDERHDTGARYRKMTVEELQHNLPDFDVLRYLRGLIKDPIDNEESIVMFALKYFQDAVAIIKKTPTRTVANYLIWRLVQDMVPEITDKYQQINSQYKQVIQGTKRLQIRWKKCVETVNERMGMSLGAMFIQDNFKKESKETASEMIHNIRQAFNDILNENEWMDNKTRKFAEEKANAMNERIGYPDFISNSTQLDKYYHNLNIYEDEYFVNFLALQKFDSEQMMRKLRQPVRKDNWEQHPVVVNAFYNPNTNDIVIPAGILQPLFYSQNFPKSLNYGGIGVVIGHEITHGFDDKGRQYDKDGNIKSWWDGETIKAFRQRAECMIQQYSTFKLEQIDEYINGRITQGENIADNGGLKQAYRAYRQWIEKNGEEPELPGIGLSHNQLFFLNYAQIWCGKTRDEEALRKIRTSVHSPGSIRVLGPLSNSREFSEAYNCPLGSRMNPAHKCSVW